MKLLMSERVEKHSDFQVISWLCRRKALSFRHALYFLYRILVDIVQTIQVE